MNRNAVATRLHRLIHEGIAQPVMIADPIALGYRIRVIFGVSVMPGQLTVVTEGLKHLGNLQYLVLCTGRYSMLAWCLCRDLDHLRNLITVEVASIPGIKEIASSMILQEVKTPYPFMTSSRALREDTQHRQP